MLYLDLDEVEQALSCHWCWSTTSPNLAWFRLQDHANWPDQRSAITRATQLKDEVRAFVESNSNNSVSGPVRLLTGLRHFGFLMNPVSFYFCFDHAEELQHVIAEVNNTPWGERHRYLLQQTHFTNQATPLKKEFHVSPFMHMDLMYRWSIHQPTINGDRRLIINIENYEGPLANGGESAFPSVETRQKQSVETSPLFDVMLNMKRVEICRKVLSRLLFKYPWPSMQVYLGIYWNALKLWRRKVPFFPHPKHAVMKPKRENM